MTTKYDVIVVGAGMVGATLALAMSQRSSLRIALIETQQLSLLQPEDAPDLRVSALTRQSHDLLNRLGIWQQLIAARVSTFTDMQVWEDDSALHFDSAETGQACLGYIIENRHLQQACLQLIRQQSNIDFICPAKPVAYQPQRLQLDDGRSLEAELIVAADGAQSPLREWAGIEQRGWQYDQSALVCTVKTEQAHQHTAWQRFLPTGPLAFLPLADPHQCSIVWSQSHASAKALCEMDEHDFLRELTQAFDNRLGTVIEVSQRAAFPLRLSHAVDYIKPGFALVGDAAHTIHPLAGQGVNIGLLDASALAEIVIEADSKQRSIGSLQTLSKYQRRRKADNYMMQLSMDAFKRVFGSSLPPVRWARRFGLQLVERNSLLKQLFMHQAAGRNL